MTFYRLITILWRVARVLAQLVWSIDEVATAVRKIWEDDEDYENRKKREKR